MAKFLLLNRVTLTDGVELKAAKELDDAVDDVTSIRAAGGVLALLPNTPLEARAAQVRRQQGRARREAEIDMLTAAFAESIDAYAARMLDPKPSVRAATVADVALSGFQMIDAVALADGDRVLVKNQTARETNGIYLVRVGVWERAPDASDNESVHAGLYVFVEEGFANSDSGWILATDNPIDVGVTPISFTRFTVGSTGTTTVQIRNESGAPLLRNTLVYVSGFSVLHERPLVQIADKDDPTKRPAIGFIFGADVANNSNGEVLIAGTLFDVDTSAFALTDQLVLGSAGGLSRPPPVQNPFTGLVQLVGTVSRVGLDGSIVAMVSGTQYSTAPAIGYAPTTTADWNPAPIEVAAALDQTAAKFRSSMLHWGNADVGTTASPRFLHPGYEQVTATTLDVTYEITQDCILDRMRIRARAGGTTGAQTITYTLRVDGLDTALLVSMPATSQSAQDLVHEAIVPAGSQIAIRVTKPGGISTSPADIMCTVRMRTR